MTLDRRTLLRLGAGGVAAAAIAGGAGFTWYRHRTALSSAPITGPWEALGPGVYWILPDLHDTPMVVPDRPHDVEETRDPSRRAGVHRTRHFLVNSSSRRLRGDRFGAQPPAGTLRIAAVGDSTTFGWGLADDETWPAQLTAELARRGHAVEVLNAGVPAQRIAGMAAWLRVMAPALGVKAVLFTRRPPPDGPNPLDDYANAVREVQRAFPHVQVLLPPVSQFDPHGSMVWQREWDGIRGRLPDTNVLDLTPVMRAAQGKQGCRVEVANGTARVIRGETGEEILSAPASTHGLPTEIYALLESDPSVRERYFFDDGHNDADGVRVLVPAIADRVIEAGWFA